MDLLLEIEVNGAKQIKERYGDGVVTIFIYPPSFSELESRLRKRATDSEDQIIKRLETEGANSPADLLITVDAGRLYRAKTAGLSLIKTLDLPSLLNSLLMMVSSW